MAVTTLADLSGSLNHLPGCHNDPKLLYCENGGYFIRILPDGTVEGTRDRSDMYIQLQLQAVSVGVVVIEGIRAKRYLAMNEKGQLHSLPSLTNECLFMESLEENSFNTYKSKEYADRNWYVAIRKNGAAKPGQKTGHHQKAILFLPMQVTSD
ncbi:fibroblast growth factor 1 isoform X1 [Callorhinchus milii]|uniref:Multifunctional fusion protein n=1 Tax=Callorhinchus milii TaxID=7868 RepID=K4FYM7_CALMI|nr:fibroblast growth factor 1 [Callorhinchus milii]XP_007900177.1 fibroblast growth factor 1 isoform X1 [Callorhinchus milii]XP_007900178.1 fibroblast growth factor 1 isoform X1 [Callorhinchus milii]XP_007900180.1 fibroblast growth factor 1 isoform X1 [Callorhinchus milii]XP_042195767.1 fibroblast growth factor 1 isoform X1 [Callorhinchus milii]AFK11477.1 fibroblast growth factor 1 (acidic) isoform 1 [Callorhinchus milii]|eukprot:gi/632967793/ref/XP_007900177.1/ PREDICTED: fibroblast growth factor 1 isoform X1 [Callorhinchus milii]